MHAENDAASAHVSSAATKPIINRSQVVSPPTRERRVRLLLWLLVAVINTNFPEKAPSH